MSSIACQLSFVRSTLPEGVKLVAVSKTHPAEAIRAAYDAGHRVFGESRPQELREKHEALPKDIEWHMIGHLQTNKIKYIAPFVALIHSVDSARLAEAIRDFMELKRCFELLQPYFGPRFDTLSMGMSHDYPLAVECGSTMVRVGSLIFGRRGLKKPVL